MTPAILSKFYTSYNGHPLPAEEFLPNVLETKYGVPRERADEAIRLIIENGKYAGILDESKPGQPLLATGRRRASSLPRSGMTDPNSESIPI